MSYEAKVKQLILPVGKWRVRYTSKEDGIPSYVYDEVLYFAVCDLKAIIGTGGGLGPDEDCFGVILPVVFSPEEEGMKVVILSFYLNPEEQETILEFNMEKDGS